MKEAGKSVKSPNQGKSLPCRQAGVIQTTRISRKFHLVVVLLLIVAIGTSQDLRITTVDFPSSFPTDIINDITQDPRGNLWLALQTQGLIKYDGTNFTRYSQDSDSPNALLSDRLECILADREGIIWIGGFDSGLSRFDPMTETFTHFLHSETDTSTIRSNSIRSLVQDNEGMIWIGTVEGLDQLDPNSFEIQHQLDQSPESEVLKEEHVRVLYVDRAGTLWAGSSGPFYGEETEGGLFKINVKTKEVKRFYHTEEANSLIDNRVTALHEDSKGNFWVGTAGDGLHMMNRDEGSFVRYNHDPEHPDKLSRPPTRKNFGFFDDHIRFIQEDDHGFIWIGTIGNGINRYDPRSQSVQFYSSDAQGNNRLPANMFWNGHKTFDGLLWFTSWQQILVNINLTPNELYQKEIGSPIHSFEEGEDGLMYMGSNNLLIQIDKNGDERILFQFDPTLPRRIDHINNDNSGNLWISSETGLFKYDISENTTNPYFTDGIDSGSPEIRTTEFIDDKTILVGTIDGLYFF